MAAWERGASPSRRNTRRSAGPSGGEPVPIARPSANCAATPHRPGPALARQIANLALRSPRPGTSRDTASSKLVFPLPFGPVMTAIRRVGRQTSAG